MSRYTQAEPSSAIFSELFAELRKGMSDSNAACLDKALDAALIWAERASVASSQAPTVTLAVAAWIALIH